ncbi:putative condensin complex subunit 2/barren [Dioscorea sansibarensis]
MKSPNLHFSVETLRRERSRANPNSSSMAEQEDGDYAFNISSPPTTKPHRVASMSTRLQSPTSHPFHLGSNDDQLERAQARAARAAAIRRKPTAPPPPSRSGDHVLFDKNQIMELYHNCIKLASENKINQKNTWELGLIDHLSEIIRVESEDESETNFQKASCTLEAGVKIYSMRVDSVHTEAYKVLGGINRAGGGDEKENIAESDPNEADQGDGPSKKELDKKLSPLSTLESSFDALNVKKFDVAFTVDPLYHQTSAQFDEGGAKGLLLSNLGVYGGCRVLFDSFEVPEISITSHRQAEQSELIDLSFAKDYIKQMMYHLPTTNDISPTLRDITNLLNEENSRLPIASSTSKETTIQEETLDNIHNDINENACEFEPWNFDQEDDHTSIIDDNSTNAEQYFTGHRKENVDYPTQKPDMDENLERIAEFLSLGLGYTLKSNAWAGPDHWKYHKAKGLKQVPVSMDASQLSAKKSRKLQLPDIEFTECLEKNMHRCDFMPPKYPKTLLLSVNRVPSSVRLPEDCHYRPESLVSLFILPNRMCLGKRRRQSDGLRNEDNLFDAFEAWEDENMANGQLDDGNGYSDVEDPSSLISKPRQVNKVDIQYDKFSKQVDVHALKDMLWTHMERSVKTHEEGCDATISFRQVLHHFPNECSNVSPDEISPHLFFICLLHLANDHCLSIHDSPGLDELDIHIPASALVR